MCYMKKSGDISSLYFKIIAIFTTEKKLKSESKVCEDKDFD